MDSNSFVLYSDVTAVYDKLISFCRSNGFTVKETKEKYFSITATKSSLLFWRNLRIEIKVLAVEKKKVEVGVTVYKFGRINAGLGNEYSFAMKNFLSDQQ